MSQRRLNVPAHRQAPASAETKAKPAVGREQPKLRELNADELRQVGGGAPRRRW